MPTTSLISSPLQLPNQGAGTLVKVSSSFSETVTAPLNRQYLTCPTSHPIRTLPMSTVTEFPTLSLEAVPVLWFIKGTATVHSSHTRSRASVALHSPSLSMRETTTTTATPT